LIAPKVLQRQSVSNSGLSSKNDYHPLRSVHQLFGLKITFADNTRLSKQQLWIRKKPKPFFPTFSIPAPREVLFQLVVATIKDDLFLLSLPVFEP
jgi:hypothetical protein